jgi:molybdate-binding protein/DNA-binding transcriptional regulator YhcF (GntR family)
MKENPLYQKIIERVRQDILEGRLKPGDQLPSVWQSSTAWGCSTATVQHAYRELAQQGLVTSLPGQGTHVAAQLPASARSPAPMRRAALVHRAESFLLETLTNGYTPEEVEQGFRQALERWRVVEAQPSAQAPSENSLRFSGSHDLAVAWLAAYFDEIVPRASLQVRFTGSLGGLIALAEGSADLAGCHLLDAETGTYNIPFVRRLLPGLRVALVTLAERRLGLITAAGNPYNLRSLRQLTRPGLRFINRQSGSGTRVWLDSSMKLAGIVPSSILGYENEKQTHSEVARAIAEGEADAGLGLEESARSYGLDFTFLVRERYDLVFPAASLEKPAAKELVAWLASPQARLTFASLGSYETTSTGQVTWVG